MTGINFEDTLIAVGCLGVLYMPLILAYDYVSSEYGRIIYGVKEDLSDRVMEAEDGE